MPDHRQKPSKPSWRGENSAEGSKSGSRGYRWNRENEAGVAVRPKSQQARFFQAVAALVVCCATIFGLIYLISPGRVPNVMIVGAGYTENLAIPHNVWGLNLFDRLTELSGELHNGIKIGNARPAFTLHGTDQKKATSRFLLTDAEAAWKSKAGMIRTLGTEKKPLILVMAMHGASEGGVPYLLPEAATPSSKLLKVQAVIDELAAVKRTEQLKLLILDATVMTDAWHFGVLRNDFARAMESVKVPPGRNLWIICSSGPDQRSWIDENGGMTAFGKAFIEGLGGKARVPSTDNVTVGSLARYLGNATYNWSARNRNAAQSVVLITDRGRAMIPSKDSDSLKALDLADSIEVMRSIDSVPSAPDGEVGRRIEKANLKADQGIAAGWQQIRRLERRAENKPWLVRETAASYAPMAWGKLRTSVVRREELRRAGLDAIIARGALGLSSPTNLDAAIASLPEIIDNARVVPLKKSQNATLAMLGATGASAPDPNASHQKTFQRLLKIPTSEFEKAWKDSRIGPREFQDAVLVQLKADENLDSAALDNADDHLTHYGLGATGLTPAEIQFVTMMRRNLSKSHGPPPALLSRAISVRRRAERAAIGLQQEAEYSYAERLLPWIRDAVDEADHNRRVAEDLLFSSRTSDHDQANSFFEAAESLYANAEKRAETVRDALVLRDATLADLPPFTHWAGRRHATVTDSTEFSLPILEHVETLWSEVHKLDDLLEVSPKRDLSDIAAAASKTREAYRRVWIDYDDVVNGKDRRNQLDPLEEALVRSVPVPDRSQFRGLPEKSLTGGTLPPLDEKRLQKRAAEQARGQARLALASLGPKLYARASNNLGLFDAYLAQVINIRGAKETSATLANLEPGVKQALSWLPGHIKQEAETDPKLSQAADQEPPPGILTAAALTRLIPPWQTLKREDAVTLARKRRLFDLLKEQARRSWIDHYWNVDKPQYPETVSAYLADAESLGRGLLPAGAWEQKMAAPHEASLKAITSTDSLALKADSDRVWTSERSYPLHFQLETRPVPNTPPIDGRPVAWVDPIEDGSVAADQGPDGDRLSLVLGSEPGLQSLQLALHSPRHDSKELVPPIRPEQETVPLVSNLFFRGRLVRGDVPLSMHHLPEIRLTAQRGDGEAKLMIRAAEEFGGSNTAIAFVIDNSRSMDFVSAGDSRHSKFQIAAEVLNDVLRDIKLKKDTWVSLRMYGDGRTMRGVAELSYLAFPGENWNPASSRERLLAKLRSPENTLAGSWSQTPLIRTMDAALKDLEDSRRSKKLLIVLTDGSDSFVPKEEMGGAVLRLKQRVAPANGSRGVIVNVVLFRTDVEASLLLDSRDRDTLETLKTSEEKAITALREVENFNPKGAFFPATRRDELKESLEGFLAQRPLFEIHGKDGLTPSSIKGIARVMPNDTDKSQAWTVAAGFYSVRIEKEPPIWVKVASDEVLMLDVDSAGGRYIVRRGLASTHPQVLQSQETPQPPVWRMAVAQGEQRDPGASFDLSLEDVGERRGLRIDPPVAGKDPVISQITPRSVWFELIGPNGGAKTPFHVEFRRLTDRVAPSWEAYLPAPPVGAALALQPSTLRAWFSEETSPATSIHLRKALEVGKPIDKDGTILEYLDIETHSVPKEDGSGREDQPCLTIRLKCAPGHLTKVERVEVDGGTSTLREEHWIYRSADRVTALYWPMESERLKSLTSITTLSADRFKTEAGSRALDLELDPNLLGITP